MNQRDRIFVIIIAYVLFLAVAVTAAVTKGHSAEGVGPEPWHVQITVKLNGEDETFQRHEGFASKEECVAFLQTPTFLEELTALALNAIHTDEDAEMVGEPACEAEGQPI